MKELKPIAIYLPQYHNIKENNEWWGDGYTEWTAVRLAEKMYPEHEQPRIPLNDNYYDLLEKETMEWQADLAKKYGIHGFCFFHYYFKNGRKILEKPAENLLKWHDIPMNYCFSWANVSWTRTWSKMNGGSMASKFEKYGQGDSVLLEQDYGLENEWKEHFEYLLPFFRDERYITIDEKPVFLFHVPEIIDCLEPMVKYWRKLAKENGLNGLYLIGVITNSYQEYPMLDAIYAHEPRFLFSDYVRYGDVSKVDICSRYLTYEDACSWSRLRKYHQTQKIYFGSFVGFDSTPRHAKRGVIIDQVTPEMFEKNFRDMCFRSIKNDNEYVFINAWNEWGEGNYLEPDSKYKYRFLEAIKNVMDEGKQNWTEPEIEKKDLNVLFEVIKEKEADINKFKCQSKILQQWLLVMENNKDIGEFFINHKKKNVAIYGMGFLGKHLYYQLKEKVNIKCFIDKRVNIQNYEIPIYNPEMEIEDVDIVVVTITDEFESIKEKLRSKTNAEIVSLSEVLK